VHEDCGWVCVSGGLDEADEGGDYLVIVDVDACAWDVGVRRAEGLAGDYEGGCHLCFFRI